ncbi:MAG: PAS domain-containing sensor histidine kinase [Flavobacteriales bacterium]|nr:PAS domain-containing sensor histidine kinase [Flavobacteriales bacterium]
MEPKEDRLIEDILDHMSDAFVSLDGDWRYVRANGNALRLMNKPMQALIGQTLWAAFPDAIGSVFESEYRAVMDERCTRVFEAYYPAYGMWLAVRAFPLCNGIGICYSDISHFKVSAEELSRSQDELALERQHHEERSTFMAMASHEFRTPLSTVLSSLDLWEHYQGAEDGAHRTKHSSRIRSSVHSMMAILNDLLSLEKLEEGAVVVVREPVDLRHFLEEQLEQLQGMRKPGQAFAFEHTGECSVLLDPAITGHVLINLLSNAIKYSETEITIRSVVTAEHIIIEVADLGIGIPPHEQERLFSRFFRASNVRECKGTGLGLTIALRYAQLLNGDIRCTSQLGLGTTFTVELPIPGVSGEHHAALAAPALSL